MTSLGDDSRLEFAMAKVGEITGGGRHLPSEKCAVLRQV